ncbi:MAG TPA: hypothetical protein VK638_40960 [Edaphobacter sp.]|nr:hypothetical protein [Edaphobacter sp.]
MCRRFLPWLSRIGSHSSPSSRHWIVLCFGPDAATDHASVDALAAIHRRAPLRRDTPDAIQANAGFNIVADAGYSNGEQASREGTRGGKLLLHYFSTFQMLWE